MIRRLLVLAAFAAAATLSPIVSAEAAPTKEEILLLKKKKLQDKKKAEAAKKRILEAKKKADALRKLKAKQASLKKKEERLASKKKCVGFFACVFGENRKVRVTREGRFQTASLGRSASLFGKGLSSRTTRRTVEWKETRYAPGSIIIRTSERALYYVMPGGKAMRYSVGVGKEGMQWSGVNRVSRKAEWPSWTPPQEMIERELEKGRVLPEFMEGGPDNPLGARAIYLGSTLYRIHGTNNEASIGGAVSSGCIRMMNADVIDLYNRVKIGAKVYVYQ